MFRINPDALDEARRMHNLTSDEKLAAAMEMSATSIQNLRRGRTSPSIVTLMKLRKLTGISVAWVTLTSFKSHDIPRHARP